MLFRSRFSLILQYFFLFLLKKQGNCLIYLLDKSGNLFGGTEGIRTLDLSDANRTLSQLSYDPEAQLLYHIYGICKELFCIYFS